MFRLAHFAFVLALLLAACGKTAGPDPAKSTESTPVKLIVAPEDLLMVRSDTVASGPVVTGSIQPERKADLRAEVSAVVLQVLRENGDTVRKGDILVKLDETAIRDNLNSANDNARNATQALDQAERTLQRLKTLRESGMSSMQALDDAEVRRNAARAELSASHARAASALQQLQRTVVRAPFDGLVSDRKVSAGDTASIGKELLKVIDPASMRFEGRISADKVGLVRAGQPVGFRINGYAGQEFRGRVVRVDPSANDITRQVEVQIAFTEGERPRVAGLYAEGNIETSTAAALTLPESALVKAGDKTSVWRIKENRLLKADIAVGPRDARTGHYEIRSGLALSDAVLRRPSSGFKDGQEVEMVAARPAPGVSAPVAAATPSKGG